jgi:Tol biopolymer transport system component
MDSSGGSLANLTQNESLDLGPAFARDGSRIAFVSNRGGGNDIYVIGRDGGAATQVTHRGDVLMSPLSWSPDDEWIVYGVGSHQDADLHMSRLDGSETVRLTTAPGLDAAPSWSPDGSTIAFVSNRLGPLDIYVVDMESRDVGKLTGSGAEEGQPSWSPDGRSLAFFSTQSGDFEVYIVDADGSNLRNVTKSPSRDSGPTWGPEGDRLVFVSDRGRGSQDLYVLDLASSTVTPLTSGR